MAVVLPQAVRGSLAFGHTGDVQPTPFTVASGAPRVFHVTFPSSDWVNVGHTMSVTLERSLDSGSTWTPWGGFGGATSGGLNKDLTPQVPGFEQAWDGQAMQLRGAVVVNGSFSWGLSAT